MDLLGGISFDSKTLGSSSMLGCYFVSFDVSIICDSSDRTVYEVRFFGYSDLISFLHFGTIRWATGRIFTLLVVFYDLRTVITAIDRSQPEFCGYVSVLFTNVLFAKKQIIDMAKRHESHFMGNAEPNSYVSPNQLARDDPAIYELVRDEIKYSFRTDDLIWGRTI